MNHRLPRVSIGLPVYNGENFLQEAIASILAQTFTDFELIISDNASTDKTEAICREFAARDCRIRYYRNSRNAGASANFNRVFELAQGIYFKWAAHDDWIAPEFLEKCVAALDQDDSVVLCYAKAIIVDEHGKKLTTSLGNSDELYIKTTYGEIKLPIDSPHPHQRFRALSSYHHSCYQVFGLIRTCILRQTRLIEGYAGSDKVLLAQLALWGKFYQIPETLFFLRRHRGQSININAYSAHLYTFWFDPSQQGKLIFPRCLLFSRFVLALVTAPLTPWERLSCYFQVIYLLQFEGVGMAKDVAIATIQVLDYLIYSLRLRLRIAQPLTVEVTEPLLFKKIPCWRRMKAS